MRLGVCFAACGVLLAAAPAGALTVTYTKIADAAMPVAGWTVNTGFGAPAVDAGVVSFRAFTLSSPSGHFGVYTGSGGALTTVAESGTPLPGGSGTFSWLSDPSISAGRVAFVANDASFSMSPAVYSTVGGAVGLVADTSTLDPEGSGPLSITDQTPSIDGQNVGFVARRGIGYESLYTSVAGALEMTANETTPVPGGAGELYLNGPAVLDGTEIAFRAFSTSGSGGVAGVYVADGGVARVVADTNTEIPDAGQNFTAFDSGIAIDSGNVVFEGWGVSAGGIFAEIGGLLVPISTSEGLREASISGEHVAYRGFDLLGDGLFVHLGGARQLVIRTGDTLDGKTIAQFAFGAHGFSGDQLAFTAIFEDSTYAVYLAQVPEPGTAVLLASGLAVLTARRRWSR